MIGRGSLQQAYRESLRRHGYRADPAQQHAVARPALLDEARRKCLERLSGHEVR